MRLEELQQQQSNVEAWQAFGDRLSQGIKASLSTLERGLLSRTGLKLGFHRDSVYIYPSDRGTGSEIRGDQFLRVNVSGLIAEVTAEALSCSIMRQSNGYRYRFYQITDDEQR